LKGKLMETVSFFKVRFNSNFCSSMEIFGRVLLERWLTFLEMLVYSGVFRDFDNIFETWLLLDNVECTMDFFFLGLWVH